jgi:hypothetical protein
MKTGRVTIVALTLASVLAFGGAAPASAKNAYISAKDARYYARDAVRNARPSAFKIRASCDRKSRSLFVCDVSWVRPFVPRRSAVVRVRGLERDGQGAVRTVLIVTHG